MITIQCYRKSIFKKKNFLIKITEEYLSINELVTLILKI